MELDKYLTKLQEAKGFNATIAITDVEGDFNDEWTDCYERRCHDRLDNTYAIKFCKATCQITAANRAITRFNAIRMKCTTSNEPTKCLERLKRAALRFKNKIDNYREAQDKARAKMAAFRRQATGA
jgi:uncharacterized protein (DUF885 family)